MKINRTIKRIIIIFTVFVLLFFIAIIYIQNSINTPYNIQDNTKKEFVIQSGESVQQIADNLENENLIKKADLFKFYVWRENLASKLQAGNYELSTMMIIPEIADLFIGGKIKSDQIKITIPEGFLNKEIDERLASNNLIKKGEFVKFDEDHNLDLLRYSFLEDKPENIGLQGYYFPDTYIYYKDSTIENIVIKMLDNFDNKLSQDLKEEIKKQKKSIFEIIILASIIEKEAGFVEDMGKVASVFQNRLDIGKALESDATINYITGSGRAQSTYDDLKIDSPYNTYKYSGLPPAPISNPGIEAIKAAVYPEETDYFYFLTDKNKKTIFSVSYDEHLRSKSKYLK
ncbi:MAG: endolytic transglycosylase MltG [Candidatus Pacebacteria bacterium]|nr:endolytic transglycosylase MltG [Candidatus Paceibacterota bacterium]